ncbi:unnamed protein product [Urochloa humidicola]
MKRGGEGSGARAAAATLLLVALLVLADATAATRRLGETTLSGPKPNNCSHDPNKPGHGCHVPPGKQAAVAQSPRLISVSKASAGPSTCTNNRNAPPSMKCPTPPAKAP